MRSGGGAIDATATSASVINATHDALLRLKNEIDDGMAGVGVKLFELNVSLHSGSRISLHLHIGNVFKIPVFTAHVMDDVFDSPRLPGALVSIEPMPFIYNAKPIGPYNRLDLIMELLYGYGTEDDPYAPVNVLVARGMNELCVKKFTAGRPNAVIQQVCAEFAGLLVSNVSNHAHKNVSQNKRSRYIKRKKMSKKELTRLFWPI
jgi:hypothetical protein